MAKSTAAVVSLTFAALVVSAGWASAQVTGARTSSPQGRGGGTTGQARPSGPPPAGTRPSPSPGSPVGARDRGGRPITGTATPNPAVGHGGGNVYVGYPVYPPYYGGGYYGGYYPYYPYYPWAFGLSFGWYGGYGAYSPYGYYGGYYPAYAAAPVYEESHPAAPVHETGEIRLKVNLETAMVYIDGALAGKGGDFDGLTSHHLVLERGSHLLEIKAPGYETFNKTLEVESGKTMTERVSLKKK